MSYYNTNAHKGGRLKKYNAAARTQDSRVIDIFIKQADKGVDLLSASQVLDLYPEDIYRDSTGKIRSRPKPPITSIRRSMSTLANNGWLERTDTQINGPYNRPESQYKLINKPSKEGPKVLWNHGK